MTEDFPLADQCHAYFDGILAPEDELAFLAQIQANPVYLEAFNRLKKMHEQLKHHAQVEPPAHLADKIAQAVRHAEKPPVPATKRTFRISPAYVAAAVTLLLVAGTIFYVQEITETHYPPANPTTAEQSVNGQDIPTLAEQAGQTHPAFQSGSTADQPNQPENNQPHLPGKYDDAALEAALADTWNDISDLSEQMATLEPETDWLGLSVIDEQF